MSTFLQKLDKRNSILFRTGTLFLAGFIISLIMIMLHDVAVLGINGWIKPSKFFISSTLFFWTMAWISEYLQQKKLLKQYSWTLAVVFVFELGYIAIQAAKGDTSHFNISTPFHSIMFSLMGVAISIATLFTLYISALFFRVNVKDHNELNPGYLWGIRLGLLIFVLFAFEGGLMAARLSHTVGAADGGIGLPFLNWSMEYGALRVAHFAGMHALQVLPLLGYFIFKSGGVIIVLSFLYLLLAGGLLWMALMGIPVVSY